VESEAEPDIGKVGLDFRDQEILTENLSQSFLASLGCVNRDTYHN
jgi:hypothetical protein